MCSPLLLFEGKIPKLWRSSTDISYSILTQKLVTLNQIYSKNRSKKMNESITTKSGEKQEVKQE